jgi:TRAP-type C4-dicarboxylate transport system permease small subunit
LWAAEVDLTIGRIVEPICALLILAEIAILASGVFSRYVLHDALAWTDELSGVLLLWLAMLGSVVAYRRRAHIRITAIERIVSPSMSQLLDTVSSVIVALFCVEMLPASYALLVQDATQSTAVLNMPRSWVVAGIVVPIALTLVLALLRLCESRARHAGQSQSRPILCVLCGGHRGNRRADCFCIWNGNVELSGAHDACAAEHGCGSNGRGNLQYHLVGDSAVHLIGFTHRLRRHCEALG